MSTEGTVDSLGTEASLDGLSVRTVTMDERRDVMDVVKMAFRKSGEPEFLHVYAPEAFQPDAWWAAFDGDCMVGVAGFPRRMFQLPHMTLPWAGVTGVATLPEYRGRGIMSTLLARGIADVDAAAIPLSILRGNRHRYQRFGWEEAGRSIALQIRRKQFELDVLDSRHIVHVVKGGTARVNDVEDIAGRLLDLQEKYTGWRFRSSLEQQLMIRRNHLCTYVAEKEDKGAYAIVGGSEAIPLDDRFPNRSDGGWQKLYELVGDVDVATELLGLLLQEGNGMISALIPAIPGPVERMLLERAERQFIVPFGMVRILSLTNLLQAYTPWLRHQLREKDRVGEVLLVVDDQEEHTPPEWVHVRWSPGSFEATPCQVRSFHTPQSASSQVPVIKAHRRSWAQALFGPVDVMTALWDQPDAWRLLDWLPLPLFPPRLELV